MPLYSQPESELREHCRRALEGLEQWLRRLINDKLSAAFGENYLDATRQNGERLISRKVTRPIVQRRDNDPSRFPRLIDAAFLEDEIDIICNPEIYSTYFGDALLDAFPNGREHARTILLRLVGPRNSLSHANAVSIHDAYRVLCYSMDVVQALKNHYLRIGMAHQYNVPTVLRVADSFGHLIHMSEANRHPNGSAVIDFSNDKSAYLHCGDTLSIEVEVDPTFDNTEYAISWTIANIGGPEQHGRKFVLSLAEKYVSTRLCVVCHVTSKKAWHKLGSFDDQIDVAYRVLPPA